MAIRIGNKEVSTIMVGDKAVSAMYQGSKLIYQSGPTKKLYLADVGSSGSKALWDMDVKTPANSVNAIALPSNLDDITAMAQHLGKFYAIHSKAPSASDLYELDLEDINLSNKIITLPSAINNPTGMTSINGWLVVINNTIGTGNLKSLWLINIQEEGQTIHLGDFEASYSIFSDYTMAMKWPQSLTVESGNLIVSDSVEKQNTRGEATGGIAWEVDLYDRTSSGQIEYSPEAYYPTELSGAAALAEHDDDYYVLEVDRSFWMNNSVHTNGWTNLGTAPAGIRNPHAMASYDPAQKTPTLTERLYCVAIDSDDDYVLGLVNATTPSSSSPIYSLPVNNIRGMTAVGDVMIAVTTGGDVWIIHPSGSSRCIELGTLDEDIGGLHALAFHKGKVYGATERDQDTLRASLVEIDLLDIASSRILDTFSRNLEDPLGMASDGVKLYAVDARGEELWEVNPSDVDDDNDKIADLPSGMRDPQALVWFNNKLYSATVRSLTDSTNSRLWDVNRTSPGSSAVASTDFPNSLEKVVAMAALRS